jgi:threonine aldolase
MIRFECDYLEGALPEIMERLQKTNLEQTPGYGEDAYCDEARKKIRDACRAPGADVHFLVGGTQTNTTVIAACLRPYQGVISASTGHIGVHETGAIEATGHKVLTIPSDDGKIAAAQIEKLVSDHWSDATHEHQVQPAMVYISQPTENGTVYTLPELEEIRAVCREKGLILFADGARLGAALVCGGSVPSLADMARLTDVFYIGGTKLGALFGEAVVITDEALKKDFRYMIKQRGGMFAKGRLLGIQFAALFTDELYYRAARHEVELALKIRAALEEKGIALYYDSPTNQQFPILTDGQMRKLSEKYSFSVWAHLEGGMTAVRFCTSWATRPEDVDELIADIQNL